MEVVDLRNVAGPLLGLGPYILACIGAFVLPCPWRYRLGVALLVCALISVTIG